MDTGNKRYKFIGTVAKTDARHKDEFIRLLKRGVLISLHKSGVLSMAQLEQCLDKIDEQHR